MEPRAAQIGWIVHRRCCAGGLGGVLGLGSFSIGRRCLPEGAL